MRVIYAPVASSAAPGQAFILAAWDSLLKFLYRFTDTFPFQCLAIFPYGGCRQTEVDR